MARLIPIIHSCEEQPIQERIHELTRTELEQAYKDRFPIPPQIESTLDGALRYLVAHPGSMMRPRVVYQIATAYGFARQQSLDLAIALEYFHTASLVFDDLPCMDNASMRRGAMCVHLAYGEASAMLAALSLINRAYALSWSVVAHAPQAVRQPALAYMEQRLGVHGVLNGQSLDLSYPYLPHTPESVERIARGKTVPLVSLMLVLPAMLGGASKRELQLIERLGACWGLAYQIVDDLKDVLQTSSWTGKTTAQDARLNRPNIAIAIGVRAALERLAHLFRVGDRTLNVLLGIRSSLCFLREFRETLTDELSRVIERAGAIPIDRAR